MICRGNSSDGGATRQLAVDRAWLEGLLMQEMRSRYICSIPMTPWILPSGTVRELHARLLQLHRLQRMPFEGSTPIMCRLETLPDDQLLSAFEQLLHSKGSAAPNVALPLPSAPQPATQQPLQQPQPQQPSWPPWGAKQSSGADSQPKGAAPQQDTAGSQSASQSAPPGAAGQTAAPAAGPQAATVKPPAAEAPPNLLQRLFGGLRQVPPGRSSQPPRATPAPSSERQPGAPAAPKQGAEASATSAATSAPSKTGPQTQPAAATPAATPASGVPAAASDPKAPAEEADRTAALFAAAGMPVPQQPGAAAPGTQQPAAQQPGGKPAGVAPAGAATTRELHATCSSMPGSIVQGLAGVGSHAVLGVVLAL